VQSEREKARWAPASGAAPPWLAARPGAARKNDNDSRIYRMDHMDGTDGGIVTDWPRRSRSAAAQFASWRRSSAQRPRTLLLPRSNSAERALFTIFHC